MKISIIRILSLATLLTAFTPQTIFAAVQTINATTDPGAQAIDASGRTDGVSLINQTVPAENTLTVADGENVNTSVGNTATNTAGITTDVNNLGNVTLAGDSDVRGTIGSSSLRLNTISAGAAAKSVVFYSTVFAKDFTIAGAGGEVTLQGNADVTNGFNFASTGTLYLENGADLTGVVKTANDGQGTLIVTGGNSSSGGIIGNSAGNRLSSVQVGEGGTLTLGHNIASSGTTVYRGGTLTLTGDRTIAGGPVAGGLIVNNTPGVDASGSPGVLNLGTNTLTISDGGVVGNGTFQLLAGGTMALTANSAASFGSVTAAGATTVTAGTVNVTVGGYIPNGTTLAVITGGGAGAANPTVTDNSATLTFTPSTSAGDTTLAVTRNSVGTTGNSSSVESALNQLGAITSDMTTVMGALDALSTSSEAASAIDQMDPTANGGAAATSFTAGSLHLDTVTGHLADARNGVYSGGQTGLSTGDAWHETGMWFKGFGGHAEQDQRGGVNGFKSDTWGVSLGYDGLVTEDVRLGFAGGYSPSSVENEGETGGTDISTYQGTVYTGFGTRPWYLNAAFSFGWHSYSTTRNISFSTINRTADADYDGRQYSVLLDGGYVIPANGWEITPLMSLEYSRLNVNGYTESGAGALGLTVGDQSYDFLQMGLGAKFAYPIISDSGSWVPELHVRWLYDFVGDAFQTTSTFAGGGPSFTTRGLDPAQSALNLGTGITFYSKGNITLSAIYDLMLKEDYISHNGEAVLRYNY